VRHHRPLPVFLSWQSLQRGCQLFLSQNRSGSPLCGMIWSTTVAGSSLPASLHLTHKGFFLRNITRADRHLPSYPRSEALWRAYSLRCTSQYTPSERFGQPGCLHGLFGFLGIDTPHSTNRPRWLYTESPAFWFFIARSSAMIRATAPSIFSVDFSLSSLRLPAGSVRT